MSEGAAEPPVPAPASDALPGALPGAPPDLARAYGEIKDGFRELVTRDPLDSLATVVLGGSYLFYLAEHGKNPKVKSYYDALLFISTCLSVGYADVFATTNAGKAIASFVMTVGPALSARALDAPARPPQTSPAQPAAAAAAEP